MKDFVSARLNIAALTGKFCKVHCRWRINPPNDYFQTVDFLIDTSTNVDSTETVYNGISSIGTPADDVQPPISQSGEKDILGFFAEVITKTENSSTEACIYFKLLCARSEGYLVRTDIVERRLLNCKYAAKSASFANLDRPLRPLPELSSTQEGFTLVHLLQRAHTAIYLESPSSINPEELWSSAQKELEKRLSIGYTTPGPCKRKTLAFVDGGPSIKDSSTVVAIFPTANALGIDFIVLGSPGHWLEDPSLSSARYRKAFLAVNMTVDEELPERMVSALRLSNHHVDGITTFSEDSLLPTVKAAALLSLPTSSPESLLICAEQQLTRLNAPVRDHQSLRFCDVDELERYLATDESRLAYPIMVKLCNTTTSEVVKEVHNDSELWFVALSIFSDTLSHHTNMSMLLENCIRVSEIDMNFALLDRQIIFEETSDSLQRQPMESDASITNPSTKMKNTRPSRLPAADWTLARNAILERLLFMGFTDGVFHVDASIQNSSILIERIKPYPPSYEETFAIEKAYGIDLCALHMLFALHHQGAHRSSTDISLTPPLTPSTLYSSPSSVSSLEFDELGGQSFGNTNDEGTHRDYNNNETDESDRILALSQHHVSPLSITPSRSPNTHPRPNFRLRLQTGNFVR